MYLHILLIGLTNVLNLYMSRKEGCKMSLQLLESNWNQIQKKVVLPLWHKDFKTGYENVKMDFDDFQSLANYELTKAFKRYDKSLGNIFTYCTMIIKRKAASELRNAKREKRTIDLHAKSLYETLEDSDITIQDLIEEKSEVKEYAVEDQDIKTKIYKELRMKEKKILDLTIDGYSNEEIATKMHLKPKEIRSVKRDIASNSNIRRLGIIYGILPREGERL